MNLYIDGVGQKGYVRSGVSRPGRRHAGQSVPAARDRRIQGHHVQLQGGIRPDLERRHHRRSRARARTRSRARPSARTRPTTSARVRRARRIRHQDALGIEGIRLRVRRSDHPGQHALLPHLRGEALPDARTTVTAGRQCARRNIVAQLPPNAHRAVRARRSIGFDEDLIFGKLELGTHRSRIASSCRRRSATKSARAARPAPASRSPPRSTPDNDDERYELSWKHSGNAGSTKLQSTYEDAFFVPHVRQRRTRTASSTRARRHGRSGTSSPSMAPIRAPARTRARRAGRIGRHHHLHGHRLVRRRPHDQGRHQVQGDRAHRRRCRAGQPCVLLMT